MKKSPSLKLLSLIVCIFMLGAVPFTSFAAANNISGQNQVISHSNVMSMVKKIQPYIKYENGSVKLTTTDYKEIGISKSDLSDVQKGLDIGNKNIKEYVETSLNSKITPQWSTENTSTNFKITFSSFEVKCVIGVGLTAGLIAAIASFMVTGSVAIFGITMSYTAVYGILSATILWVSSIAWLVTDGAATTITIPKSLFTNRRGVVFISNGIHSSSKSF